MQRQLEREGGPLPRALALRRQRAAHFASRERTAVQTETVTLLPASCSRAQFTLLRTFPTLCSTLVATSATPARRESSRSRRLASTTSASAIFRFGDILGDAAHHHHLASVIAHRKATVPNTAHRGIRPRDAVFALPQCFLGSFQFRILRHDLFIDRFHLRLTFRHRGHIDPALGDRNQQKAIFEQDPARMLQRPPWACGEHSIDRLRPVQASQESGKTLERMGGRLGGLSTGGDARSRPLERW